MRVLDVEQVLLNSWYLQVDDLAHGVHAFPQGQHGDYVGRGGVDDDVVVHRQAAVLAGHWQRRIRLLMCCSLFVSMCRRCCEQACLAHR